jgi:hypothetical protein
LIDFFLVDKREGHVNYGKSFKRVGILEWQNKCCFRKRTVLSSNPERFNKGFTKWSI